MEERRAWTGGLSWPMAAGWTPADPLTVINGGLSIGRQIPRADCLQCHERREMEVVPGSYVPTYHDPPFPAWSVTPNVSHSFNTTGIIRVHSSISSPLDGPTLVDMPSTSTTLPAAPTHYTQRGRTLLATSPPSPPTIHPPARQNLSPSAKTLASSREDIPSFITSPGQLLCVRACTLRGPLPNTEFASPQEHVWERE